MPDGGTLTITSAVAADDANYIQLSVADTGSGMPPEVIARAFDPFFTTKPTGKGTGLGLSQVYGVVRQAGGEVAIESKPGKGTKVTIRLPRAAECALPERRDDEAIVRSTTAEKLLLVDDDSDVREVVGRVLSDLGYDVTQASSAAKSRLPHWMNSRPTFAGRFCHARHERRRGSSWRRANAIRP